MGESVALPSRDWHLPVVCLACVWEDERDGCRKPPLAEGRIPCMPRYRAILIALLIVLPLVLAACGKGGGGY